MSLPACSQLLMLFGMCPSFNNLDFKAIQIEIFIGAYIQKTSPRSLTVNNVTSADSEY